MQNAAHAYLQTQVGTTGRGEIIVMLYDGALRFLAQAREKMEARDMAGKGMLISRALDIINELDSSLNMEAGGELAQNLHNLYFLCNTRLLQANLKLDTSRLDSVVEILTGLRSAFAEILNTPEAQAACAKMGAQKPATQQAAAPRPAAVQQQVPLMNRGMAANMYGQQARFRQGVSPAGLRAPILPPHFGQGAGQDTSHMPAEQAPAPQTAPMTPPPAPSAPPSPRAFQAQADPRPAPPQGAADLSAPQPDQQKSSEDTPKNTSLRPGGGFASKKLATYGKLLQNK